MRKTANTLSTYRKRELTDPAVIGYLLGKSSIAEKPSQYVDWTGEEYESYKRPSEGRYMYGSIMKANNRAIRGT